MKKPHVLLFNGYADWEIGHILPELRRLGGHETISVGFDDAPVTSMGGLKVTPDKTLSGIDPDEVLIFIIPGGYMWEQGYPEKEINQILLQLNEKNILIAAICAATTVLAKAGLLKNRKHTSNSLNYIKKMVHHYESEEGYIDSPAVTGENIITASGLASVDFTMQILQKLDISTQRIRGIWYDAFKKGIYLDDLEHSA